MIPFVVKFINLPIFCIVFLSSFILLSGQPSFAKSWYQDQSNIGLPAAPPSSEKPSSGQSIESRLNSVINAGNELLEAIRLQLQKYQPYLESLVDLDAACSVNADLFKGKDGNSKWDWIRQDEISVCQTQLEEHKQHAKELGQAIDNAQKYLKEAQPIIELAHKQLSRRILLKTVKAVQGEAEKAKQVLNTAENTLRSFE